MSNDNKVISSKNALNSMLVYYYQALKESGCEDTRKQISTDIAEMINITEAQEKYMEQSNNNDIKVIIKDLTLIANNLDADNPISALMKVDIDKLKLILNIQ